MDQRYIPLTDTEALRAAGFPFSRSYCYKARCLGLYPGLFLRIGGRVVVDMAEMQKLLDEDRVRQQNKFARLRGWL